MFRRMLFGISAVLATLPAAGQGSNPEFDSASVSTPNYHYGITVGSLEKLDFKDFRVFYRPGDPSDPGVTLHEGRYSKRDHGGYEEVTLEDAQILSSSTETKQYAVISLHWTDCGGSCTTVGKIQVFTLRDHHPVVVQQIEYDRHAEGTGALLYPMSGHLDIVARTNEPSPNCCPRHLDIMRFDWDGERFLPKASKTIPNRERDGVD